MNRASTLSRISKLSEEAGEWAHYSAALWVSFASGGVELAAIYLMAVALPGTLYRSGRAGPLPVRRLGALLSSAGLIALWGLSSGGPVRPVYLFALALTIGSGAALAGRPVAFSSTLNAGPGPGAVTGSIMALLFAAQGRIIDALALAAVLTFLSSLISRGPAQDAPVRVAPPSFVRAPQLGLAFVVGIRIVEPTLIVESARVFDPEPVSTSLFALAWTVGAAIGWKAAPQLDARVVLSAPFAAAAGLAALGVVSGPAMVTLWGVVGGCAGTLGGSGVAESSDSLWPRGRLILLPATFLGALFAAWWLGTESGFELVTGGAAALLIASGFIGLVASRRVLLPKVLTTPSAIDEARTVPVAPRIVQAGAPSDLLSAIAELRTALSRSRSIRSEALATYRAASTVPLERFRSNVRTIVETSVSSAERLKARVRVLANSLEDQSA